MTQKPNHKKPNRIKPYVLRHKLVLVKVPEEEYYRAENRWFNFWGIQLDTHSYRHVSFQKFLRLPRNYWMDAGNLVMPPASASKIALLNSPHYHALLMAYKSKNLPQK